MSAATATLYGAIIGGVLAVVGGAVALFVEDWLRRRRGKIRIEVRQAGRFGSNQYQFAIRFFNDKDVNISLWDPELEFYQGARLIHSQTPSLPRGESPGKFGNAFGPVDLPSRTTVVKETTLYLEMNIRGDLLVDIEPADRASFVATVLPGNKRISVPVPNWRPHE